MTTNTIINSFISAKIGDSRKKEKERAPYRASKSVLKQRDIREEKNNKIA